MSCMKQHHLLLKYIKTGKDFKPSIITDVFVPFFIYSVLHETKHHLLMKHIKNREDLMQSIIRSSLPEVFCKKDVLRNFTKFTGKHLCQSLFFNKVAGLCNFIKKETQAQVFFCEFCEISKNTFFRRTPLVAAS